jgi:BASS family bile acid:Na+ symporter
LTWINRPVSPTLPSTSDLAMTSPIPPWLAALIGIAVFAVMFSLGLMLGREQIAAALRQREVMAAALFAALVPVPVSALLCVMLFGIKGVVGAGILLMAISPGAPIALRRAIEAGHHSALAPPLHVVIVMLAIVTVPASLAILAAIFQKDFAVTPLDVARQVFVAQLLPLGLGAALHALRPQAAARIEGPLARITNLALLALAAVLVAVLWPLLAEVGWVPVAAGAGLTACALGFGAACAGRNAAMRPVAAVAAAMRNPGLALLIATVNKMPPGVAAAVFAYTLGGAAVVTVFVVWQARRKP